MKFTKPLLVFVFTCQACLVSSAQGVGGLNQSSDPSVFETWVRTNSLRDFNENEGIVGELYLFENWTNGAVNLIGGTSFKNLNLRYNIYTDELIVKKEGLTKPIILEKNKIKSFTVVDPTSLEELTFTVQKVNNSNVFVQTIYLDKTGLFLQKSTKLIAADNNSQAYGSGQQFDKYVEDNKYYLKDKNSSELKEIKLKKSDVFSILNKKDLLNAYVKTNKLKIKNQDHLVKLLKYYDSL